MFLDIIIPQSDETEDDIKTLLNSLNIQKNVDFSEIGIIIVNKVIIINIFFFI